MLVSESPGKDFLRLEVKFVPCFGRYLQSKRQMNLVSRYCLVDH